MLRLKKEIMKRITIKRNRFDLRAFLHALHEFSLAMGGDGDPMPIEHDDIVYFDTFDLGEVLLVDMDEEDDDDDEDQDERSDIEIPDASLKRLEAGYRLYAMFGISDGGFSPLICADQQRIDVEDLADEDEEDEDDQDDDRPRPPRTNKQLERCENTPVDENRTYGYLIALQAGTINIEATCVNDMSGDCEIEPVTEPNLVSDPMRTFARSFFRPAAKK